MVKGQIVIPSSVRRKLKVRPVSLTGAERDKAWARITAAAPSYTEYQGKTDREIPIVRLTLEA